MTHRIHCVLLIDDNEADNYFHRRTILENGFAEQVICFDMADEALGAVRSGTVSPNLIFLDINMPGMDGWEFLEEYVRLPKDTTRAVVVIMLTTSLNPVDKNRAESLPIMASFCHKPLTASVLEQILREHFGENYA